MKTLICSEVGHVVGPVKTQFGYHLIKVEDKKDAETSVYEDVADTIKNIILQQKRNDVYGNKIAELKEKMYKNRIFLHSVKYKKMPSTKTLWEASF